MPTIFRMPHKAATIQLRQTRVNGINSQVYTMAIHRYLKTTKEVLDAIWPRSLQSSKT